MTTKPVNSPDPKAQLVERIVKMLEGAHSVYNAPYGGGLKWVRELAEAIASAWMEDVEKARTDASKWIKYNANQDKYLKRYIAGGLHVDSNQLAWDLKTHFALTNKSKEQA